MERYLPLLLNTPLFAGIAHNQLQALLSQLQPVLCHYAKGETLLLAGDEIRQIGIVLEGEIEAAKHTRAGQQFTVSRMRAGGVFGDVLSGSHSTSPVTVTALRPCTVLLLSYSHLLAPPPPGQEEPMRRLLANLISVISDKYFQLDRRIDLLLQPSIRKRLVSYLLDTANVHGSTTFTIPYNRTTLAQYLGCERSALSRVLSAMVEDGLVTVQGRCFCLPEPERLHALF